MTTPFNSHESGTVARRWTIYVCDTCGRVHTSSRAVVCRDWAEHDSGGKLVAVEVVPAPPRESA